jgi:hypothetical protein
VGSFIESVILPPGADKRWGLDIVVVYQVDLGKQWLDEVTILRLSGILLVAEQLKYFLEMFIKI